MGRGRGLGAEGGRWRKIGDGFVLYDKQRVPDLAFAGGVCWRIDDLSIDDHGGRTTTVEVHGLPRAKLPHLVSHLDQRHADAGCRPSIDNKQPHCFSVFRVANRGTRMSHFGVARDRTLSGGGVGGDVDAIAENAWPSADERRWCCAMFEARECRKQHAYRVAFAHGLQLFRARPIRRKHRAIAGDGRPRCRQDCAASQVQERVAAMTDRQQLRLCDGDGRITCSVGICAARNPGRRAAAGCLCAKTWRVECGSFVSAARTRVHRHQRCHHATIPNFSVENESIDVRLTRAIHRKLHMRIVVRVKGRISHLETFPPLAVQYLVILVLAGSDVKKVCVYGSQNLFVCRRGTTYHLRRPLTPLQLLACAHGAQFDVRASKIDANNVHVPRPAGVDGMCVADAERQLAR